MADYKTRRLERQRFESMYREQFDRVAAYLLARAERDLATEALSRTFEVAWRRIADVPREPLPWLLGVARRVLADLRRTQGRQDALVERIAASGPDSAGDHADALISREGVLAALGRLTDFQQEVLLLVAWDGLSQREAAAALGCSRGAVALRLHRARKRLEQALAETAEEEHAPRRPSGGSAPCPTSPNANVTQEATP
jgi:RNA polymerase sigma-70 factor (ECF subfamily)